MLKKTVLITSGRMPVSLELARGLHRSGARVIAVDTVERYICQSSAAVAKSFVIPSPVQNFSAYKENLLTILKEEKVDHIFPMTEDVFFISQFASEIPTGTELFTAPHELLLELHHKQRFIDLAKKLELPVPASIPYTDPQDLPAFAADDYILKKVYSRAGTGVLFPKKGEHPSQYSIPADGSWLIQEKLKGQQFCSCTVMDNGHIVAHVVYEPAVVNGTTSIVFKETLAAAVDEWIVAFAEKTGFHGTISFDFFVDGKGVARAIECNPRPTSGYHVIDSGVLAEALLQRTSLTASRPKGRRAQILLPTLISLPSLWKGEKLMKSWREIRKARDVIFDAKDWMPLFYQVPIAISTFYQATKKGVPVTSCMMEGVEWNEPINDINNFQMI